MKAPKPTNARDAGTPAAKSNKGIIALMFLAWIAVLTVVASIGFSSYMVYFGTSDSTAKVLILPQVIFGGLVLIALPLIAISKSISNK